MPVPQAMRSPVKREIGLGIESQSDSQPYEDPARHQLLFTIFQLIKLGKSFRFHRHWGKMGVNCMFIYLECLHIGLEKFETFL